MVSPVTGNSWVVEILASAAGRALDLAAPGVAARLLTRATDEPQPAATRIGLLEELARAEAEFGLPGAPEHLLQALALTADPIRRAELGGQLGAALLSEGRQREAEHAFAMAVGESGDPDHPLARELPIGPR